MRPFPRFLRIAALGNAPKEDIYSLKNADGNAFYCLEAQFVVLLSDILQFSYQMVQPGDGQVGRSSAGGNWSGVIGLAQRGECDMAINMIAVTEERSEVVDFTNPYYITDVTFLTRNPEPLPRSLVILHPFSLSVWLTFVPLFLAVSVLLYAVRRRTKPYQLVFLRTLGSVLEQSLELNFRSSRHRVLVFTWITSIMFISYSYKGTLLSFLSFPPMKGVRDIQELSRAVAEGSHVCRTYEGSYLIASLLESDQQQLAVIGRSLAENAVKDIDFAGMMRNATPTNAVVTARSFLRPYQDKFFLSRDSFFTMMFAVALRRDFCCKETLDWAIRRVFEAGLYEKIRRDDDLATSLKYVSLNADVAENRVLTFDDVAGALGLLMMGHTMAVTAFLVEMHFRKRKRYGVRRNACYF